MGPGPMLVQGSGHNVDSHSQLPPDHQIYPQVEILGTLIGTGLGAHSSSANMKDSKNDLTTATTCREVLQRTCLFCGPELRVLPLLPGDVTPWHPPTMMEENMWTKTPRPQDPSSLADGHEQHVGRASAVRFPKDRSFPSRMDTEH